MSNNGGPIRTDRMNQIPGKPAEAGELQPGAEQRAQGGKYERGKKYMMVENCTAKRFGLALPRKAPPGSSVNGEFVAIVPVDPETKLDPGINLVDPEKWAELKKQVMVQKHLDTGKWRELGVHSDLSGLEIADAVRILPTTYDQDILKSWQACDERAEVQRLINEQFELLKRQRRDLMEPKNAYAT